MQHKTNIYSRLENKFSFDEMTWCGNDANKHKATSASVQNAIFFFGEIGSGVHCRWHAWDFCSQAVANIKNAEEPKLKLRFKKLITI